MKKFSFIIGLVCSVYASFSQSLVSDITRFATPDYSVGSTSRMRGFAGVQAALGGDISVAGSNPAGLGFYNRSEASITSSLDFIDADTEYLKSSEKSFKNNFNFANLGVAFNFNKGPYTNEKFKGGTLVVSISRVKSFHLDRTYEGINESNSLADALASTGGNQSSDDLGRYEYAAFDQYLINPVYLFGNDTSLVRYEASFDGGPKQSERIRERGSQYQLNVAWGGNYDDIFYFGGGISAQLLNYRMKRQYKEEDFLFLNNDSKLVEDARLASFSVRDALRISGTGINFNAGVIFRPVNFFLVGMSYTSPTFLSLTDSSFFDLDATWKSGATYTNPLTEEVKDISNIAPFRSNIFTSNYNLRTPSRISLGGTLFVSKSGFLSGDIELVNYASSLFKSNDFSVSAGNSQVREVYQSVTNIRIGGEYRFGDFRLRAGYALFPSPYRASNLEERTSLSFGFGYRNVDYFLDFALVNNQTKVNYFPYFIDNEQPVATSTISSTLASATFGLFF